MVTGVTSLGNGRIPFASSATALSSSGSLLWDMARGCIEVRRPGASPSPVTATGPVLVLQGGTGTVEMVGRTNSREVYIGASRTATTCGVNTANVLNFWYNNSDNIAALNTQATSETSLSLRRNLSGSYSIQKVRVDAADSGGTGYRQIVTAN